MLVSEESEHDILAMDLLEFAMTKIRLVSVIERVLFHHFQDLDSAGAGARSLKTCFQDRVCVSVDEIELLKCWLYI
jgi:hypothetical protein